MYAIVDVGRTIEKEDGEWAVWRGMIVALPISLVLWALMFLLLTEYG